MASANRRRSPRTKVRLDVAGELCSVGAHLVEISAHSCLVAASGILRFGDVQTLRVDGDGDRVLYVRVVHVMRVQGGPDPEITCVAGLEFLTPDAQHDTIQRLIAFCNG